MISQKHNTVSAICMYMGYQLCFFMFIYICEGMRILGIGNFDPKFYEHIVCMHAWIYRYIGIVFCHCRFACAYMQVCISQYQKYNSKISVMKYINMTAHMYLETFKPAFCISYSQHVWIGRIVSMRTYLYINLYLDLFKYTAVNCVQACLHMCVCNVSHRTKPDSGSHLLGAPAAVVHQRFNPDRGGNNCGMTVSWD